MLSNYFPLGYGIFVALALCVCVGWAGVLKFCLLSFDARVLMLSQTLYARRAFM